MTQSTIAAQGQTTKPVDIRQALVDCEESHPDFGECLHVARARRRVAPPIRTYDRKAAKALGANLLGRVGEPHNP